MVIQKSIFIIQALLIAALFSGVATADSYRCGTKLVNHGDLEIQVRKKCGKPGSQKVVGYTLKGIRHHAVKREREYVIERWVYGPRRGFYHEIIFEAGRVVRINQIKE